MTKKDVMQRFYNKERPDMCIISCDVTFSAIEESKEGDIIIDGWFITENLIEDRGMIVRADAFKNKDGLRYYNGRVLAFHNQIKEPVGKTLELQIVSGRGIRGKVLLYRENSELFKRAIRDKTLRAFSIGFSVEEYTYNEKTEILTITKAKLREVSIVNIGADEKAVFNVQNSLKDKKEQETFQTPNYEVLTLSNKPEQKKIEEYMTEQEKLGVTVEELQNILNTVKDSQTALEKSAITKSELADRFQQLITELDVIKKEVEEAKNAKAVKEQRLAYTDFRSMITDFVWLTDDDGNKLGNVPQKAYCLFQMPVDYDKMENGYALKNLRDLHDAVLIADAMHRFNRRDRYNIQNLKLYKQLIKAVEPFDKDVALAMAGGNTGYGAEWLPTEMSSEFNEILRVKPTLYAKFPTWQMSRGGSAKYPFQNGKATVYRGSEALVDNAEEARKTNVATGAKTFTPEVFIGALVSSEEITEDAILDMVTFIRNELATALLEGLESAICNGDDSDTHFDNAAGTTPYAAYDVETTFKGLRKLGITNARDIEVSSSSSGVNALELVNFTDAKQDLEVAGLNPAECLYVTGIKGRTQIQQALFKEDALGVLAYMLSGTLPAIDGSDIYISGQYVETLSSAGIQDSTADTNHTSSVCVHKPSFRIAQRRGVTLEFNKDILTQQRQFVATARWDFGKVCADSIKPVSEMINIQHTA